MDRKFVATLGLVGVSVFVDGCAEKTTDCDAADNCVALEESTGDDDPSETLGDGVDESDWGDPQLPINKDVDILFVIDNSGSMGEEQALLAANVGAFINVLESEGVDANYRIGITTTDNGNSWCNATTPEGGKLVLSSCKNRLGDFLFGDTVDVQDLACNDICTLGAAELEILPTTTDVDDVPSPRPWLENIEGKKNIPDSTGTAAAFACFGPQGINGCGFESQLESMYLALSRTQTNTEDSYGFMRPSAILAIVFVTDEADCSANKDWSEIFDEGGNKVFWSDPSADFPTSAVCWNAGVECYGDPSEYETCDPVDKDVNGNVTVSPSAAVLHPMSRYIGLLQGLEDQKQELNADQEIIVALIGGVDSTGQPHYSDASDPNLQNSFGIGPGCSAPNPSDPGNPITAVPPVRLRDLTEEFTPDNMFSICDSDYSPALEAIADRIRDQIQPACYTKCAADTNPATAVVDPECTLEEDYPGPDGGGPISECLRDDANGYVIDPQSDNYAMPSDAANVCYAVLVDTGGQTADPNDDMSPECMDSSYNLEFKLARRPGFAAPGGTAVTASCTLADFPAQQCPGIGG
jgi:hypothetical protein